jgi:hypothetical protein
MSKEEMIEGINDLLEDASDADVESVYWMVKMELT